MKRFNPPKRNGRTIPSLLTLEDRAVPAAGGGFLAAGALGEYFANESLAGAPAFTRRDVRIDFDWGTDRSPGGSNSRGFSAIGTDHFSARWTGQVSPQFTETYTFLTTSDDGVRLFLKPTASTAWTTLIDHWESHASATDSTTFALTAGQTYDLRLEYREATGPSIVRLHWASPNTPEEPIESATLAAINAVSGGTAATLGEETYADAVKMGRSEWGNPTNYYSSFTAQDAQGWPLADGTLIVWEGRDAASRAGAYQLRFNGRADVSTQNASIGQFRVGAINYGGMLPAGAGYDPVTNTTIAEVVIAPIDILYLTFRNSQRTAASPVNSGVTAVQLLRPTAPGAATFAGPSDLFYANVKSAIARFTTLRFLTADFNPEVNWLDRILPSYMRAEFADGRGIYEYEVALANETGKDLYVTIPMQATNDYVTKLAQLLHFGSDGVNPYTAPMANPIYPGLNPNLRLYVEWSNEVWNWAFIQSTQAVDAARTAVQNNTGEGQIINFDGQAPQGDYRRYAALKTVEASDTFRAVWGDAAMGDRVRMLLEYQYDNQQDTAMTALRFLDNYFNNGDGVAHVAVPHPVSHYIWGAGGALYYGSGNNTGQQSAINFANGGFESPSLAMGPIQQNPAGSGWTFTGNAGIYRATPKASVVTSQTTGTPRNNLTGAIGYRFTVGNAPVSVYDLGRWVSAGNGRTHALRLVRTSDHATVAQVNLNLAGASAGQYRYAALAAPVVLATNTTYDLVSEELAGGDAFGDQDATIALRPELTLQGAISAAYGNPSWNSTTWNFTSGSGGHAFGPVDLHFATSSAGALAFPADPAQGVQSAYVGGGGSISQAVYFPAAGVYSLDFHSAAPDLAQGRVSFTFNGQNITPGIYSQTGSPFPYSGSWMPGARWSYDYHQYLDYGSAPFTVSAPGAYMIALTGTGAANQFVFFDDVRVNCVDAIFAGGLPSIGQANGQVTGQQNYTNMLTVEAAFAQAFGLKVVAYEGGWSLGGDFDGQPLQSYAKYFDDRARQANIDSLNQFARAGGAIYTFGAYEQWPMSWTVNAANYPLTQGIDDRNASLPVAPANGTSVPAILRPGDAEVSWSATGGAFSNRGWASFNVLVPASGSYTVVAATTSGGQFALAADDATTFADGPSGSPLVGIVNLTPGLHSLKVKATSGSFTLSQLTIAATGSPAAPTLIAATDADAAAILSWTAVPGASGYRARLGTTSGSYTSSVDLGNVTTSAIAGLVNKQLTYFVVSALNSLGEGLPSNERALAPLGDGQLGNLATWDFAGSAGFDAAVAAATASSRLSVGPLTRSAALTIPPSWAGMIVPNSFSGAAIDHQWGQSLAEAVASGKFFEFTIGSAAGLTASLAGLAFTPYFQNSASHAVGAGVTYSTNGTAFSADLPAVPGSIVGMPTGTAPWTVDLSGHADLQNLTAPVTVRIYLYGSVGYEITGLGGAGSDVSVTGTVRAASPPVAMSTATIDDGSAQRSRVRSLTLSFASTVVLAPGAFVLTGPTGPVGLTWTSSNAGEFTTAAVSFSGPGLDHGSLSDGRYVLRIVGGAILDAFGRPLDGDANGLPGGDRVIAFHRLFGDADGNGAVDISDYIAFRSAFANNSIAFDSDGDGSPIDINDFIRFRSQYAMMV